MKILQRIRSVGFTLIEMMLVAGIVASLLVMGGKYMQVQTQAAQMNRASAQIQQILNAGLAYYVNNGQWPTSIAVLQTGGYLPATPTSLKSPWATNYTITALPAAPATSIILQLSMSLPPGYKNNAALGKILAGKLPFGTSTTSGTTTTVNASVNIPGMNLNNAPSVNYASLYHTNGCVPVPACPVDLSGNPTAPEILVSPAAVSGMNDPGTSTTYPLTSFTAYALINTPADPTPPPCPANSYVGPATPCNTGQDPVGTNYWRVCLQVITTKGVVQIDGNSPILPSSNTAASYNNVLALTRCTINNEPSGSPF